MRWTLRPSDQSGVEQLASQLRSEPNLCRGTNERTPAVLAALLARRGIASADMAARYREAADETVSPERTGKWDAEDTSRPANDGSRVQSGENADGTRLRIGFNFTGLLEGLFVTLTNGGSPPQSQPRADPDLLRATAEDAAKRQHHEREEADEEWRERQRAYGE